MERKRFKLTDDNSMDGCIFPDGTTNYSVLDLIAIDHKYTLDDHTHSKLVWSKFKKNPIHADVVRLVKYDTDYYRMTPALCKNPMMSIDGMKRLLAILPRTYRMDPMAHTLHRETLSATLTRFIDGDKSMVEDWGSKLDTRLALTLSNIDASAEIVSGVANAASSVKINATAVIETEIEDTSAISKFFLDPDNRAFTSADGNLWWHVPNFNRAASFDGNDHPTLSETWSRLLHSPLFADQIKDPQMNDVQYVKKDRIALELFELGTGPNLTPVMTILGLHKLWNLRRIETKELSAAVAAGGRRDLPVSDWNAIDKQLHQAYMMSKIDEIRVMSINGAGKGASSAASAETVSSVPAASPMQVRLLV